MALIEYTSPRDAQAQHQLVQTPLPQKLLSTDYNGQPFVGSALTYEMLNTVFPFAWKSEVLNQELVNEEIKRSGQLVITYSTTMRVSIKPMGAMEWLHFDDMGIHTAQSAKSGKIVHRDQLITLAMKGSVSRGVTRCCRQFGFGMKLYDKAGKLQQFKEAVPTTTIEGQAGGQAEGQAEGQATQIEKPKKQKITELAPAMSVLYTFLDTVSDVNPLEKKIEFLSAQMPKSTFDLTSIRIDNEDLPKALKLATSIDRTIKPLVLDYGTIENLLLLIREKAQGSMNEKIDHLIPTTQANGGDALKVIYEVRFPNVA